MSSPPSSAQKQEDDQEEMTALIKNQQNQQPLNNYMEFFEHLHTSVQFAILVFGVFVFFGIHNFLQEAIMQIQEKKFGVMLGYTEVLGVVIFSYLERTYIVRERGAVAPMSYYPLLTGCLLGSSALSNMALNYINFPTKVVFRSSKLIPTMMIASIMHRKIFSSVEYTCAVGICTGLILFAAADWELAPTFHPVGLILVTLSVFSDAVLPNAQERLFGMGASRLEVTLFTNVFALIFYTASTLISGDLTGALGLIMQNRQLAVYYMVYITVAYFAISVHMNVVKRFGGVAAVLVATGRKGMTLILSFLLFPKAFSWYYPIGAMLVLGGLLVASLYKIRNARKHDSRLKQHVSDVENGGNKSEN
mmetsp:Transcript_29678/g.81576  ORF Transcript_29678/g.81576 Transcript_29678/m.81576 type:complete len:363 (-) Transcript_29678:1139-2227(-)